MSLLIGVLNVILIFTSLFLVVVVLMQRASSDGGMGSAMGGGSMESTFGAETNSVLSGATIKAAIVFFVISFVLYLAHIYQANHHDADDSKLPTISVPAAATPAPAPLTAPSVSTGPVPVTTGSSASPGPQPQTPAPVEQKTP